jgi:hypothetical protein
LQNRDKLGRERLPKENHLNIEKKKKMVDIDEKVVANEAGHPNGSPESTLYDSTPAHSTPAAKDGEVVAVGGTPASQDDLSRVDEEPAEAPLEQMPSRAQKMGKKKVVVIILALCVRCSQIPTRFIRHTWIFFFY